MGPLVCFERPFRETAPLGKANTIVGLDVFIQCLNPLSDDHGPYYAYNFTRFPLLSTKFGETSNPTSYPMLSWQQGYGSGYRNYQNIEKTQINSTTVSCRRLQLRGQISSHGGIMKILSVSETCHWLGYRRVECVCAERNRVAYRPTSLVKYCFSMSNFEWKRITVGCWFEISSTWKWTAVDCSTTAASSFASRVKWAVVTILLLSRVLQMRHRIELSLLCDGLKAFMLSITKYNGCRCYSNVKIRVVFKCLIVLITHRINGLIHCVSAD